MCSFLSMNRVRERERERFPHRQSSNIIYFDHQQKTLLKNIISLQNPPEKRQNQRPFAWAALCYLFGTKISTAKTNTCNASVHVDVTLRQVEKIHLRFC